MTYKEFITNIIETRGRIIDDDDKERHHILPKCLGGSNAPDNLVDLTLEEHFIAHKLLTEENPESKPLAYAFRRMSNVRRVGSTRTIETPEEYREARLENKRKTVKTHYGQELREETKRKISASNTGKKRTKEMNEANRQRQLEYLKTHENPYKGRKHSAEARAKMSKSHEGRDYSYLRKPIPPEEKERRVKKFKETYYSKSAEERAEIVSKMLANRKPNKYWQGETMPDETRKKISETLKQKHLCSALAIGVYCEETDETYRSMTEAEKATGVDRHIIRKYINGKMKNNKWHFKEMNSTVAEDLEVAT